MSNVTAIPDVPVPEAIIMIIGPSLIGAVMSWGLYGILVVQLYIYYFSFPKDSLSIKATVYGLFIIDTFQNAVCVEAAWFYLVSGWGRPLALEQFSFGFRMIPGISGVVSLWVQGFYCWRIFVLGKSKPLWLVVVGFVMLMSLTQSIASLFVTGKLFTFTLEPQWHSLEIPIGIWNVGSVLADVTIAISMIALLWDARRKTGMAHREETRNLLNRLMQLTVETGAMTAAVVLVDTGVIYGLPNSTMFLIFAMMQSKVYTNSLMATLNSRSKLFNQRYDAESAGSLSSGYSRPNNTVKSQHGGILVQQSSIAMVDMDMGNGRRGTDSPEKYPATQQSAMYFARE